VPLAGPAIDRLVAAHPFYAKVDIPGGLYPRHPGPTPTYGTVATLVSSAKVPDAVVYALVHSVFDGLDRFKALHPAFAHLDPARMIKDGLTAPLHPGAARYYKERGWLK
jgi:TRAP transporter TAXI family solute receptor